jgi:hypothetical protein
MLLDDYRRHLVSLGRVSVKTRGWPFVVQPAGDLLARKASRGSQGQLPRGGPRPKSVLCSLIRSLIFSICVVVATLFFWGGGLSARGGGGASQGCFRLTTICWFSMTFTAILTPKERRAFNVSTASVISRQQKRPLGI